MTDADPGPSDEADEPTGSPTETGRADGTTADLAATLPGAADDPSASAPEPTDAEYPLQVENLQKHFGGITAADGVTFEVEAGTLTGLIGPNGAGKSTTFNLVTGVHEADGGTVTFEGEDITNLKPHEVASRGLVRTFQIARQLEEMTVIENVMLAPRGQRGEALWRSVTPGARRGVIEQEREIRDRAWDMLEFFELAHLAGEYAGTLSGGQRKLLEMARALMTDPQMVLLDEPLAGVNPTLEEKLLEHVHQLRSEGYTFLLVEHDMDVIMSHCERVIVMHQGRVLAEGTPDEIRSNEEVIDAYLGADV